MEPTTSQQVGQNPSDEQTPQTTIAVALPVSSIADSIAEAAQNSASTLSDGGASLAAQLGNKKEGVLTHKAYLGVLSVLGIGLSCAASFSYLPIHTLPASGAEAHVAAAATMSEEAFDPFADITINARAAYVYDATTGEALYARNADAPLPLASITKVALALAISEVLEPNDTVTISEEALERGGGGLAWGEVWRARDLIDFTLISSSNAGAEALAEAADAELRTRYTEAPANAAAVWRMNTIAAELGMASTHFNNVSGLDMTPTDAGAVGSARDVATLFSKAIQTDRTLFAGTTRSNQTFAPLNFPQRTATNTNNALADIPGIIMGKTGTTDLAGGNLAIAFNVVPERPVIIVILGSGETSRYDDMRTLVEASRKFVQGL